MKACRLALLSTFLLAVSAKVSITNPVKDTVWDFDSKSNKVKWTHQESDKGPVDINLIYTAGVDPEKFQGSPIATQRVEDVTKDSAEFDLTGVDKSKYPPSAEHYFVRFGDVSGAYSHLFTVKGGTGSASSSGSGSGSSGSSTPTGGSNPNGTTTGGSTSGSTSGSSGSSGSTSGSSGSSGSTGGKTGATGGNTPSSTVPGNSTVSSPTTSLKITPITTNDSSDATKITASFVSVALAIAAFLF